MNEEEERERRKEGERRCRAFHSMRKSRGVGI